MLTHLNQLDQIDQLTVVSGLNLEYRFVFVLRRDKNFEPGALSHRAPDFFVLIEKCWPMEESNY